MKEYEKISTDTKRYTYLLGEGRGCRTAIEQFGILKNSKQSLSDITSAFSVEALTKQFYKDLFEWYLWAIDDSSNITFPNSTAIEDDDRDDIEKKIIRMITRIMFVWFIKQKDLVPNHIFDIDFLSTILKDFNPYSTSDGSYYNAILQNLFFGTLNRAIKDEDGNTRKFATSSKRDVKTLYRYAELFTINEQEVINLFAEIPFLNGGLFECLDKTRYIDGVEQCFNFDGFSRNDARFADGRFKHRAIVPNNLFFEPEKGLISILSRYNFTIEENSPEEQQVALDPELLGIPVRIRPDPGRFPLHRAAGGVYRSVPGDPAADPLFHRRPVFRIPKASARRGLYLRLVYDPRIHELAGCLAYLCGLCGSGLSSSGPG